MWTTWNFKLKSISRRAKQSLITLSFEYKNGFLWVYEQALEFQNMWEGIAVFKNKNHYINNLSSNIVVALRQAGTNNILTFRIMDSTIQKCLARFTLRCTIRILILVGIILMATPYYFRMSFWMQPEKTSFHAQVNWWEGGLGNVFSIELTIFTSKHHSTF